MDCDLLDYGAQLQQQKPDDYVLATGLSRTVREFVELAFLVIGTSLEWHGTGTKEIGSCKKTGEK